MDCYLKASWTLSNLRSPQPSVVCRIQVSIALGMWVWAKPLGGLVPCYQTLENQWLGEGMLIGYILFTCTHCKPGYLGNN